MIQQEFQDQMTVGKVRTGLADAINRVAFGKERVVLTRQGREVAVLISIADWNLLKAAEENEKQGPR